MVRIGWSMVRMGWSVSSEEIGPGRIVPTYSPLPRERRRQRDMSPTAVRRQDRDAISKEREHASRVRLSTRFRVDAEIREDGFHVRVGGGVVSFDRRQLCPYFLVKPIALRLEIVREDREVTFLQAFTLHLQLKILLLMCLWARNSGTSRRHRVLDTDRTNGSALGRRHRPCWPGRALDTLVGLTPGGAWAPWGRRNGRRARCRRERACRDTRCRAAAQIATGYRIA